MTYVKWLNFWKLKSKAIIIPPTHISGKDALEEGK